MFGNTPEWMGLSLSPLDYGGRRGQRPEKKDFSVKDTEENLELSVAPRRDDSIFQEIGRHDKYDPCNIP